MRTEDIAYRKRVMVLWWSANDEVKKFARDSERPYPFNIRKWTGPATMRRRTLATILLTVLTFKAEEVIHLTDARQQDHFQQLGF